MLIDDERLIGLVRTKIYGEIRRMSLLALPHILEWNQENYKQLSATEIRHLQMILGKRINELQDYFEDAAFKYKRAEQRKALL
jgi:hypothetical protein